MEEDPFNDALRDITRRLREPIPDESDLLNTLAGPLSACKLLPKEYKAYSTPLPRTEASHQTRWISTVQSVILQHIVPVWEEPLAQNSRATILEQYFCPIVSEETWTANEVALYAYSTLLSSPISPFAIQLLARLVKHYPADKLHEHLFSKRDSKTVELEWESLVKAIISLPSKVSNAAGSDVNLLPVELRYQTYAENLYMHIELVVHNVSEDRPSDLTISSISHLLSRLISTGAFSQSSLSPSFFDICLPIIQRRLVVGGYRAVWTAVTASLSYSGLQSFTTSLLSSLPPPSHPVGTNDGARYIVKKRALLLDGLLGSVDDSGDDLWGTVTSVFLGRTWNEHVARVLVCWISGLTSARSNELALNELARRVLDIWASPQHNQNILLARHQYISSLFLITLSYIPSTPSSFVTSLSFSEQFLSAVTRYLGHLDPTIRRLGMGIAEYVASRSGHNLDFGGWEGGSQGRAWFRELRALILQQDRDVADEPPEKIDSDDEDVVPPPPVIPAAPAPRKSSQRVYDSDDDSLVGHSSVGSPSSSRSVSPTPSELDEIERDPTLRTGAGRKARIQRPVYLVTLGELLRASQGKDEGDAEKVEIALVSAEALIRRKKDYGTELEENAADLTITLIGLQDNFETDRFEEHRQAALDALVACCPRVSASCIIEQFFHHQYSTAQRFSMLSALALGARELAGLPIAPTSAAHTLKTAFPSKTLPMGQHQKYITADDVQSSSIAQLANNITRLALDRGKADAEGRVPEIVREKTLRLRQQPARKVVDLSSPSSSQPITPSPTTFTDVAAEYFIVPLINRFWSHLRDEQARETRSQYSTSAYRGAGTGMILDALVLSQFLRTLTVLLHASRHSPAFLRILAPEALEVAVTLGTRPVSAAKAGEDETVKQGSLIASALELALVIFDAATDLDEGRELALEKTLVVLAVRDWAAQVFKGLEDTGGLQSSRPSAEGDALDRMRRGAAGVLLRIEEMLEKWRRSMIAAY